MKGDLGALACLLFESRERLLARLPEDLDPDRRVERPGIRCLYSLGNKCNVRLHRGGGRVNLDNRNLISGLVQYSLKAITRGSLASMSSTRPARALAHCRVAQA